MIRQKCAKRSDERTLGWLLTGDEDSAEFHEMAAHLDNCTICRERLETISGSALIDTEARALLLHDPWADDSAVDAAGNPIERGPVFADKEGAAEVTHQLDFLSPPSHPEMLGRLGRYEIERVIGAGGMGVVLKAFDTELNRPVAVKVLARHLAWRGAARRRFAREAKAAAAVVHEHVVAIHNVEAERELPFLVMQYISGESLQTRVDRLGPFDVREILRIGIQTAAGLAAAHEQGVVHRDVKPGNILLESGVERVLLTDFGLARTVDDASLTHTGVIAGTPHYMSPEQASGDTTDQRSDLFSLGSVLYFMATGHPPFRAERAMGVLNRICHDPQRPVRQINPDIPRSLSLIIDRLLQKKASRRFSSATEVREALATALAGIQQGQDRPQHLLSGPVRRAVLVAAVCLTALAGGMMLRHPQSPDQVIELQQGLLVNPAGDDVGVAMEKTAFESADAAASTVGGLAAPAAAIRDDSVTAISDLTQTADAEIESIRARLRMLGSERSVSGVSTDAAFDREVQLLHRRLDDTDLGSN